MPLPNLSSILKFHGKKSSMLNKTKHPDPCVCQLPQEVGDCLKIILLFVSPFLLILCPFIETGNVTGDDSDNVFDDDADEQVMRSSWRSPTADSDYASLSTPRMPHAAPMPSQSQLAYAPEAIELSERR